MKKPPLLKCHSVVRIVSTAGVIDPKLIEGAAKTLKDWGLIVRIGKHAAGSHGRFAGNLDQRLEDLQEALNDAEASAIFFSRGGYGTVHLLEKIDLTQFMENPKWLIGYSDITMLHTIIQNQGYASIHGGMAKMLCDAQFKTNNSAEQLQKILFGTPQKMDVPFHPLNKCGNARGVITGGNLSILYSLRSTPYDLKSVNKILFIEDIGEKPYEIDRMMYNLKLSGVLAQLSGLIVGQFSDCEEDLLFGKSIYEIIASSVSAYKYPVAFNFPIGHIEDSLPLLLGSDLTLTVSESKTTLNYEKLL